MAGNVEAAVTPIGAFWQLYTQLRVQVLQPGIFWTPLLVFLYRCKAYRAATGPAASAGMAWADLQVSHFG